MTPEGAAQPDVVVAQPRGARSRPSPAFRCAQWRLRAIEPISGIGEHRELEREVGRQYPSRSADTGQQPLHDPLVGIVEGSDPCRRFRRERRGLLFTLPACGRKGHPFPDDCPAHLVLWHHDRTPSSTQDMVRRPLFARVSSAICFSRCIGLRLRNLVSGHQRSDLMLYSHCRRRFDPASKPVCAHWALLSLSIASSRCRVTRLLASLDVMTSPPS